jgi:hypothetical protein
MVSVHTNINQSRRRFLDQEHSVGSKILCCLPQCRVPQCLVSIYIVGATGLQKTGVSLSKY